MAYTPRHASPPHILTLVLATSAGALAMNMLLPSLPAIARHYDADYSVVQLAVSLYLVATAVLQLGIGPASDRFGRRPVMIVCLLIFLVGSAAAAFAPTIELLLAARILQAFSSAGMVLSRAIVRDTVATDEAASKIGYITMGMSVVPMISPLIGGFMDEIYGWQSTFIFTLAYGAIALAVVLADLGETNQNRSPSVVAQIGNYPELLRSRRFWGYTLTAAFTSGTFFAFLGGGPYVATEIFGMRPSQYGFYFGLISIGYMAGNFLSGRFSRTIGINTMMLAGNLISAAGMAISLSALALGYVDPLILFGLMSFVGVGNGMTMPNANAGMVSVRPHLAGSASGLGGALQIGGGAALSVVSGAILGPETGPAPLVVLMLLASLAAIVASLYVIHVARNAGRI